MPLNRQDLSVFSKIVAAALLVCGFIIMGLLIGRQVAGRGGPGWAVPAGATLGAVIGLSQGWSMIRPLWKGKGRSRP